MLGGAWTSGDEIKAFDHLFMFRFDTRAILYSVGTQIGEGYEGARVIGSYELYKNAFVKDGEVGGAKLPIQASLSSSYDNGSAYASMYPNLNLDANTVYGLRIRGATVPTFFWTTANFEVLTPVPEPETYAMLLAGLGMTGFIARRRSKIAANG